MIKIVVLGSGSKGNSTYIDVDGRKFLLDCGFTKIATKKRLATIGRIIEDIEGVFVTHDHKDHCSPWIFKEDMVIENLENYPFISKFLLSHDSPCTGYTVQDEAGNKIALITDTGCIPEDVIPNLYGCSAILIETNYNVDLLVDSPYPTELQERIASHTGHLRDQCAAELIEMVACPKLKYVVAMHLSSKCINETLLAFDLNSVTSRIVPECEVIITSQATPSKMVTLI